MSALCQKRTKCAAVNDLFDHLVGAGMVRKITREAGLVKPPRKRSFQQNHELVLRIPESEFAALKAAADRRKLDPARLAKSLRNKSEALRS